MQGYLSCKLEAVTKWISNPIGLKYTIGFRETYVFLMRNPMVNVVPIDLKRGMYVAQTTYAWKEDWINWSLVYIVECWNQLSPPFDVYCCAIFFNGSSFLCFWLLRWYHRGGRVFDSWECVNYSQWGPSAKILLQVTYVDDPIWVIKIHYNGAQHSCMGNV